MKRLGGLIAIFLAGCAGGGSGGGATDKPQALANLQGDWVCVSSEQDGKENNSERGVYLASLQGGSELSIKGDKFTFKIQFPGQVAVTSGSIKLHPTSDPKGLDRTWEESRNKDNIGKTELAIYEFDGEKLRIVFGDLGGKERPKSLKTVKGDKQTVLIYAKKK